MLSTAPRLKAPLLAAGVNDQRRGPQPPRRSLDHYAACLCARLDDEQAAPLPGLSPRLLIALRADRIRVPNAGDGARAFDSELDEVLRLWVAHAPRVNQLDRDVAQVLAV